MTSYTVFPFKASGVAALFISIDEEDDAAATAAATRLLEDHKNADRVTVWRQDRIVFSAASAACIDWLAAGEGRNANCAALNLHDLSCPLDCGRLATQPARSLD